MWRLRCAAEPDTSAGRRPVSSVSAWVVGLPGVDPFAFAAADKIAVLVILRAALAADVRRAAPCPASAYCKGADVLRRHFRLANSRSAVRVLPDVGGDHSSGRRGGNVFDTMRTLGAVRRAGLGLLLRRRRRGTAAELAQLPSLLAEKVQGSNVTAPADRPWVSTPSPSG